MIRSKLMCLSAFVLASAFAGPALAQGASDKCPANKKEPVIYGIGGSTMGSVLGPMLAKVLKKHGIKFSRWGKASSGLARPDFHDWPRQAPGLMDKHKPDIVVVSLGTNDYQALYEKGNWVLQDDEKWETLYGERVDALLNAAAGKKRERLVIWSGPYAFEGKNAVVRAPIVNRIMKERVEAFAAAGGRAIFHDAYGSTSADGKPLDQAELPNVGLTVIRQKDGVHLTEPAVEHLLVNPIVDMVLPCFPAKGAKSDKKKGGN